MVGSEKTVEWSAFLIFEAEGTYRLCCLMELETREYDLNPVRILAKIEFFFPTYVLSRSSPNYAFNLSCRIAPVPRLVG